jgi:signal peptidase complex subunit 2
MKGSKVAKSKSGTGDTGDDSNLPADIDFIDKPLQVDKWDGCAVKNALDDTVKKIMLDTFGHVESHTLMDGRLIICTIACVFAVFAMIWDYYHPFPESRTVLIVCVLAYFVMMVVLTFYTTYCEQGIFLEALDIDPIGVERPNKWVLSSARVSSFDSRPFQVPKHRLFTTAFVNLMASALNLRIVPTGMTRFDDIYSLEMIYIDGKTGVTRCAEITKSVAAFIDENGLVCEDIFAAEVTRLHAELLVPEKKDQ